MATDRPMILAEPLIFRASNTQLWRATPLNPPFERGEVFPLRRCVYVGAFTLLRLLRRVYVAAFTSARLRRCVAWSVMLPPSLQGRGWGRVETRDCH